MNYTQKILQKTADNTEVVGIIGLGYVGLPLAVNFAEAGVKVIGFDKSEQKVNKINSGENCIKDIRDAILREVVHKVTLKTTTDFTRMKECDALIICVTRPLDKFRKPDMSCIEASCITIGGNMKPGTFISLESTTYPTTTEDFMLPLIIESSKTNPYFEHEFVPHAKGTSEAEGVKSKDLNMAPIFGSPILPSELTLETKHFTPKIHPKY